MKKILENNLFIFKYAISTVPVYTVMVCFCRPLHTVVMYFEFTYMIKFIVDCFQYKRPFIYVAYYIFFIFMLTSVWLLGNTFYNTMYEKKHREKLQKKIKMDIYRKSSELDYMYYDNPNYYNDFVWVMNKAQDRIEAVLNSLGSLMSGFLGIITCGIFMVSYDLLGLLFVALSITGSYFLNIRINKKQYDLDVKLHQKQREKDYIGRLFYLNDYVKEIRLSNIKAKLYKDYEAATNDLVKDIKRESKLIMLLDFVIKFVFNSFIFTSLYMTYLLYKTIVLKIFSYGTMAALFQTAETLKSSINRLAGTLPGFQENSLYIDKFRCFFELKNSIVEGAQALNDFSPKTLKAENLSFSYGDNSGLILKNINFTIHPYEKIVIVGQNGAGKTTLVNLLLRLYDPVEGFIRYNDVDIKDYKISSYRENFGVVLQDYQLFAFSIAENIVMDEYCERNSSLVKEAIDKSGFADKLKLLPDGIDTLLTREYDENGVELSGGEAQKIAIARALYKRNSIIIMDEPSSALDPISEYHLNKTIIDAAKDKTVIFISHRLSTTKMADRIFYFENGEITEQGSHEELLEQNGKYAYMFNLQAEKYRSQPKDDIYNPSMC